MKKLVEWSGDHLDKDLVYQFIRAMSVYPVGTLIELESGKVGVVIESNPERPDKPVLNVFYNLNQRCYESPQVLDLDKSQCKESIKKSHDPDKININIADFV